MFNYQRVCVWKPLSFPGPWEPWDLHPWGKFRAFRGRTSGDNNSAAWVCWIGEQPKMANWEQKLMINHEIWCIRKSHVPVFGKWSGTAVYCIAQNEIVEYPTGPNRMANKMREDLSVQGLTKPKPFRTLLFDKWCRVVTGCKRIGTSGTYVLWLHLDSSLTIHL